MSSDLNYISPVSLIKRYDCFLLDLWGVVHDGSHLYEGVRDVLAMLRAQHKTVIFISNAPRRSEKVKDVLSSLGVGQELYRDAISSGEVGYQWLAAGKASWGQHYYYIGPTKDARILEGLDYQRVDDLKSADFLLNVGFGSEEQTQDDFSMLLRAAKALSIPMLCLNPDLEVVKITGERFACAGVLGKYYEDLGGKITWFGKPYADIYDHCAAMVKVPKASMLAVGDSLHTDIVGGAQYGIDTLLITGGILKHEMPSRVRELAMEYGVQPTYVAGSLFDAFEAM